ncbi:hypothetical protein D3872_23650 [Massilia cavernae]|uniref:Uncharacterized protein n=1 Tax=Massilia cavernae TaxID=2320864 RepID=A0A418X7P3_9BURK|nr:hypothetical protein D3872_23650 [Massilia cavernae]
MALPANTRPRVRRELYQAANDQTVTDIRKTGKFQPGWLTSRSDSMPCGINTSPAEHRMVSVTL